MPLVLHLANIISVTNAFDNVRVRVESAGAVAYQFTQLCWLCCGGCMLRAGLPVTRVSMAVHRKEYVICISIMLPIVVMMTHQRSATVETQCSHVVNPIAGMVNPVPFIVISCVIRAVMDPGIPANPFRFGTLDRYAITQYIASSRQTRRCRMTPMCHT